MLVERVVRVRVLDRKGRSIPGAQIEVFVNGDFLTKAVSGNGSDGTVYTLQLNDAQACVELAAEYKGDRKPRILLADGAEKWDFVFDNVEVPVPREKPFWEERFLLLVGIGFVLLGIVLAAIFPNPTPFQFRIYVGAFALGLAAIASEVPGFLHVQFTLGKKLAITAAGALAIFVLGYFFGPQ